MMKNDILFASLVIFTIVCILVHFKSKQYFENLKNIDEYGYKYTTADFDRDNNLKNLVVILNNNTRLFQNWAGTEKDYTNFINILEPFILMPPAFPKNPILPFNIPISNEDHIDCMNTIYSNALTGKQLKKPKIIIDFISFGYDIDKLELRFYEYYDVVDVFVIYEAPRTLSGLSKPLYYQKIKDDIRFIPFKEKIIYLSSTPEDIKSAEKSTRAGDRIHVRICEYVNEC